MRPPPIQAIQWFYDSRTAATPGAAEALAQTVKRCWQFALHFQRLMLDNSCSKQMINADSLPTNGIFLCSPEQRELEFQAFTAVPRLCHFREDRALKNSCAVLAGKKKSPTNLIWVLLTREPSIRPCKLFLTLPVHENFDFGCWLNL